MARSCCEAIVQSPLPSRPIDRNRPSPGLLAHVLVSKYSDHLPLYRQWQIFAREDGDLDRSTLADWVGRSTAFPEPLADDIGRLVRRGEALFADDTPVKMLAPGQKKTKTGRVWTCIREGRPWSGQSPPYVWYQFTVGRKSAHPGSHLSGYKGWVHADGYSGYNGLFGDATAREMTSYSISLSSNRSATIFFSHAFSCYSSLSRLISGGISRAYFVFQLTKVTKLIPAFLQFFATAVLSSALW